DLADDRRSLRVDLEASRRCVFDITDCGPRVDRDSVCNRALLGALETSPRPLAHVLREDKDDARLKFALWRCPVGRRVGRVDRSACLLNSAQQTEGVLRVAGQAIEPRDDQTPGLLRLDASKGLLQARAIELAARLVEIGQDGADSQAMLGCELPRTL